MSMQYEDRLAMAKQINSKPVSTDTPEGQKFSIGDMVKIVNPGSWFSAEGTGDKGDAGEGSKKQFRAEQDSRIRVGKLKLCIAKAIDEIAISTHPNLTASEIRIALVTELAAYR